MDDATVDRDAIEKADGDSARREGSDEAKDERGEYWATATPPPGDYSELYEHHQPQLFLILGIVRVPEPTEELLERPPVARADRPRTGRDDCGSVEGGVHYVRRRNQQE